MTAKNTIYKVYENDLKFSEHIDPDRAIWANDDVKKKYLSNEVKTLKYRLNKCKNEGYKYLDLSYLDLTEVPNFRECEDYSKLRKIKYLFMYNNNLTDLGNSLDQFDNLEVVNVSCNQLRKIKKIPDSVIELVCDNNKLTSICSSSFIRTLDCSFNRLENLGEYPNLQILLSEKNSIKNLQSLNAKHIVLKDNPLVNISPQKNVEFLNIENVDLMGELPLMPNLKWLICHNTKISGINALKKLEHIEMTKCVLLTIPYLKFLQDILCDLSSDLLLDSKLKLKTYLIERDSAYYIFEPLNI